MSKENQNKNFTVKEKIFIALFLLVIIAYFKLNVVHDFVNDYFRGINEILDDMWYYITEYKF